MVCIVAKLAVNFQLMVFEYHYQAIGCTPFYFVFILRGEGGRGERSFTVVFNHYNRELAQNKIWEGVKNRLSSCSHNGEDAGSWALMLFCFHQ